MEILYKLWNFVISEHRWPALINWVCDYRESVSDKWLLLREFIGDEYILKRTQ